MSEGKIMNRVMRLAVEKSLATATEDRTVWSLYFANTSAFLGKVAVPCAATPSHSNTQLANNSLPPAKETQKKQRNIWAAGWESRASVYLIPAIQAISPGHEM